MEKKSIHFPKVNALREPHTFLDSKYHVIISLETLPISHSEPKLVHSFHKVGQAQDCLMVTVVYNILHVQRAEKIIKSVVSNVLNLMYFFSILQDKFFDIYMFTVNA